MTAFTAASPRCNSGSDVETMSHRLRRDDQGSSYDYGGNTSSSCQARASCPGPSTDNGGVSPQLKPSI